MKRYKFDRKELYDLVWSLPASKISKEYNISVTDLKRICLKMFIPQPKSDYWVKIRFNKPVVKTKLPENSGNINEVNFNDLEDFINDKTSKQIQIRQIEKNILKDTRLNLYVPKKLKKPDDLIKTKIDNSTPYYQRIDIRTSGNLENRALRIMDTFIKNIRLRGHQISVAVLARNNRAH